MNSRRGPWLLAGGLLLAWAGPAAAQGACPPPRQAHKVALCHRSGDRYVLLSIARSARPAHMRHGDRVPGLEGLACDCAPVAGGTATVYFVMTGEAAGPQGLSSATLLAESALSVSPTGYATAGTGSQGVSEPAAALSPGGEVLFVGHNVSEQVESFRAGPEGALLPGSVLDTGWPASIAPHPALPIVYVVGGPPFSSCTASIVAYDVVTGASAPGPGVPVADSCRGSAVHPAGTHLVTTHMFGPLAGIQVHALGGDGTIGATESIAIAGAGRPSDAVFDPTGRYLYVSDLDRGIHAFSFDGGSPSPLAGSPFGTPFAPNPSRPEITSGFVHDFAMSPEGALFVLSSPVSTFTMPTDVVRFRVGPDGGLTGLPAVPVPDVCHHVAVSGDGRTLLMTSRLTSQVRSFAIAPVTLDLAEAAGSPYPVLHPAGSTSNLVVRD